MQQISTSSTNRGSRRCAQAAVIYDHAASLAGRSQPRRWGDVSRAEGVGGSTYGALEGYELLDPARDTRGGCLRWHQYRVYFLHLPCHLVFIHFSHAEGSCLLVLFSPRWMPHFSFYKGSVGSRMQRSCRRQKECSLCDGKKMSNTHGDEGEGTPPHPSPWGLGSDVGTKCRHSGTISHPDTLSLAEARTDSTNPHKARETSVKQRRTAILGRHPVKISARAWAPSAWLYNDHVSAVKLWTNH